MDKNVTEAILTLLKARVKAYESALLEIANYDLRGADPLADCRLRQIANETIRRWENIKLQ